MNGVFGKGSGLIFSVDMLIYENSVFFQGLDPRKKRDVG